MRFAFIELQSQHYPVAALCKLLAVSRSGFYDYLAKKQQGLSTREQETMSLVEKIKTIHETSKGRYGSPRIHTELSRQQVKCSLSRVKKLMLC